jgi:hypothetical protein
MDDSAVGLRRLVVRCISSARISHAGETDMTNSTSSRCETCYGEGVFTSEQGPVTCPDCAGLGELASALVRTERRLRDVERLHGQSGSEAGQDVRWLVSEVRRSHHALLQILAASQEVSESDAVAKRIHYLANDVLGLYPPERA